MDSPYAQVAIPLAAGAASAYSPYVARGIGPALGAMAAMGNFGNQAERRQLLEQELAEKQARDAANTEFAQAIQHSIDLGTPQPRGKSFAEFMGEPPSNEPIPPQQYPAGALHIEDPWRASMIRGMAKVAPGTAYTLASQEAEQQALPATPEEGAQQLVGLPPGVTGQFKTRRGMTVTGGGPTTLEEEVLRGLPTEPEARKKAAAGIYGARYMTDKSPSAYDIAREKEPGLTYEEFERRVARGRAQGETEGKPQDTLTASEANRAARAANEAAKVRDETGAVTGFDRATYDQVYDEEVQTILGEKKARKGGGAGPRGGIRSSTPLWTTKDGKMGFFGKDAKGRDIWRPLTKTSSASPAAGAP